MHVVDSMKHEMAPKPATKWQTLESLREHLAADDTEFRRLWYATAIQSTIGIAVIKYRYDHGLSQAAFGELVGMSQGQVSRLEDGEHCPTFDTLLRITAATGLEISLTIGPKAETRRAVPKALRGGVSDATDQVVIGVREAARPTSRGARTA